MKKTFLYFFLTVFVLSIGISCSSDDDSAGNTPQEETVELVGDWQLHRVDFTTVVPGGFPLDDQCMSTLVLGYQFKENHNLAIVIGANFPSGQDLWTWEEGENSFIITQNNIAFPPYNFGLEAQNVEFEKIEGKWQMSFDTTLGHGSKATFTLIKQEINEELLPIITNPDGSEFSCAYGN